MMSFFILPSATILGFWLSVFKSYLKKAGEYLFYEIFGFYDFFMEL